MFTLVKTPSDWLATAQLQQHDAAHSFTSLPSRKIKINREQLITQPFEQWALIRVVSGIAGLMIEGNRLFALESGDCWLGYPGGYVEWYQEGAIELEVWRWSDMPTTDIPILIHRFSDLMLALLRHNSAVPADPMPGFDFYKSGDIIIAEGEPADSVFTLIQGKAKVMVGDKQVGEAKENEIIGLQAMLLHTTRTASVIADGPCSAVRVHYDKFKQLIESRPELVISTMESMAQQINRANQRITR